MLRRRHPDVHLPGLFRRLVERLPGRERLLAVLLHELDHLAFLFKREREIRTTSNRFYAAVMEELVAGESGASYGMAAPSRPA